MNLKTRSICMVAAAMMLPVFTATEALADPAVYWGTMTNSNTFYYGGQDGGGEFRWSTTKSPAGKGDTNTNGLKGPGNLGASQFLTFCVELNEHINWNETVYSFINDRSKNTNITLKNGTAYLYSQFVKGALSSYSYSTNASSARTNSANSLQHAIWYFQGQIGLGALDAQADAWRLEAIAAVGGTGFETDKIGNVRILNNWTGKSGDQPSGSARQDMIVMIPLPAPVWMAGLGLFGVIGGTVIRRRSSDASLARDLSL